MALAAAVRIAPSWQAKGLWLSCNFSVEFPGDYVFCPSSSPVHPIVDGKLLERSKAIRAGSSVNISHCPDNMKDSIYFKTITQTFAEIFASKAVFEVPEFQHDYSWTTDELEDLWYDMLQAQEEKTRHYMGYLVFQEGQDEKKTSIIDGQQRLTTISIMICAALKKIKTMSDSGDTEAQKRYETLRNMYIGYLDPVSLVCDSKITLNRHNNDFYQDYISALQDFPRRGIINTNKLLKKSFEFFEERLGTMSLDTSAKLAEFIESAASTFFFTVITVSDELNAFRVFETLNARGVQLSSSDLLKNYILSIISRKNNQSELDKVEKDWEAVVRTLGSEKFPEFLRYYWNSCHQTIRKTELFKEIRRNITSPEHVFQLLKELRRHADLYVALQDPQDETWSSRTPKLRENLYCMSIFGIRQHIPLLFSVFFKLGDDAFEKVLDWLTILTFRYNIICEKQPNEQDRVYNGIAVEIVKGKIASANDIKQRLMKLYPDDTMFYTAFAERAMDIANQQKNKIVKYILCALEDQLEPASTTNFQDPDLSIEHIFPEHPEEGWPDFKSEADAEKVYKLGNYTLLTRKSNRDLQNKTYQDKRPVYAQSNYKLTRQVAQNYDPWDVPDITRRQRELARQAKTIWKIS